MGNRIIHIDAVKVIYLATGQDSRQNLVLFCSCQDKDGMTGWFFQRFQESVESRSGQHVYLVDDIYFIFSYLGRNTHLFHQLADIVNGVVGCGIQFMDVV